MPNTQNSNNPEAASSSAASSSAASSSAASSSANSTSISGGAPAAPSNPAPANQAQSVSSSVGSENLSAQDTAIAEAIQLIKNGIDELEEKKRKMGEREGPRDIATLWKGTLDAHTLMNVFIASKNKDIETLQDPDVSSETKMDLCQKVNKNEEFKQLMQQGPKQLYKNLENSGVLGKIASLPVGMVVEGLKAVGALNAGKAAYDVGKKVADTGKSGLQWISSKIRGESTVSGESTPSKLSDSADNSASGPSPRSRS